tara:strand:+ start:11758 stop:12369 length:612 start_codon:yes stop_codon:yes gene_type:complete
MSKKWTESYARDNAIVDYKDFNRGYNAYKSSFNGGIDRTMMPTNSFNKNAIQDFALHNVFIRRAGDMAVLIDSSTGSGRDFRGLSYNTYNGGWVTIDEFELSNMKDGMLHWEFQSHVYNDTYHSENNPKSVSIRLLFDGVEVCNVYKIPQPIITFRMISHFPITSSPNNVVVQARSVSRSTTEDTDCLFTLLAMQHLMIGRWR